MCRPLFCAPRSSNRNTACKSITTIVRHLPVVAPTGARLLLALTVAAVAVPPLETWNHHPTLEPSAIRHRLQSTPNFLLAVHHHWIQRLRPGGWSRSSRSSGRRKRNLRNVNHRVTGKRLATMRMSNDGERRRNQRRNQDWKKMELHNWSDSDVASNKWMNNIFRCFFLLFFLVSALYCDKVVFKRIDLVNRAYEAGIVISFMHIMICDSRFFQMYIIIKKLWWR